MQMYIKKLRFLALTGELDDFSMQMLDLYFRGAIIEMRGWITKNGRHIYIGDSNKERLQNMIQNGNVTLEINRNVQNRHYVGTNEYNSFLAIGIEKSYFTVTQSELQQFLNDNATTGKIFINSAGDVKERLNFGKTVGYDTLLKQETTWVTVFYSKKKTHLSPYSPMPEEEQI